MADPQQFNECLVELALQRSLADFETALKRLMSLFELTAWACIFPPSLHAAGRPLFIAHGIKTTGELLQRASRDGINSLGFENQANQGLLDAFATEFSPEPNACWRILRITRDRRAELTMFVFRSPRGADFSAQDTEMLGRAGQHLDRCFLLMAKQQEQDFMAGLFRLVSNLYSEGLCVLDSQHRVVFENRNFREHMLVWEKGRSALQSLSLPRQTVLPEVWKKACADSFVAFEQVSFGPSQNRMVVTQGPLLKFGVTLGSAESLEGTVRYLAFQSSLGVRPYLLLISNRRAMLASELQSMDRIADEFKFSRRERQMAELILDGKSAHEISRRLAISMPTVKTHIRNILRKSGTKTRLQFAGRCRRTD